MTGEEKAEEGKVFIPRYRSNYIPFLVAARLDWRIFLVGNRRRLSKAVHGF